MRAKRYVAARTDSHTRRCSVDVLLAVRAHADDRGPLGRQRALQRRAERLDVRGALPADAVERRGVREVEPVRGRDVLDERLALRGGRAGSGRSRRRRCRSARSRASARAAMAASRPPTSCASATSPISSTAGPARGGADAERGRDGPVDPVRAAVGEHPERRLADREERLDVAHRHRGGDDQRRLRRAAACRARRRRAARSGPPARRPRRSPAPPRGRRRARRRASSCPCACAAASWPARRASCAGRRRRSCPTAPAGSCQALSGSKLTCSASSPASHVRSGLEVGRSPTRSTRSGRVRARPRRAAARRSARSPPGRGGRRTAARPAAGSPPRSAKAASEARQARVALRPAGDDDRVRARLELFREAFEQPRRGLAQRPRPRHPRPPAVAAGRRSRRPARRRRRARSGSRKREVQVHRPGPPVDRGPERAAGELAQPLHARRAGGVVVDLEVPLGGAAVELDLVDRLPGADVAQLRRAVGGQHEHRHARLVRLDHRGRVVGGGGARGAGQRGREAGRLGQAEREERRAALVEVGGRAQPRVARQRQHQRRRARAGGGARRRAGRSGRARRRRRAGRDRCRFQA